jgi:hypothetical protein
MELHHLLVAELSQRLCVSAKKLTTLPTPLSEANKIAIHNGHAPIFRAVFTEQNSAEFYEHLEVVRYNASAEFIELSRSLTQQSLSGCSSRCG